MVSEWADYFRGKSFESMSWWRVGVLRAALVERLNQIIGLYAPMRSNDERLK